MVLAVYNMEGQKVVTPGNNVKKSGTISDAVCEADNFASGICFVHMTVQDDPARKLYQQTNRLLLMGQGSTILDRDM